MVNRTTTTPSTSARAFQFARILLTMSTRYSGQQKLAKSIVEPDPAPPLVVRPKPWPRAPVSAIADPSRVSKPLVGVVPRAWAGACFTGVTGAAFLGVRPGVGIVISGVFAAGGRIGSGRFGASGGVWTWTARPPIEVMPPLA